LVISESRKRVASEVDNNEQVVRAERATKLGHTDVKSNTDSLSIKATDVAFDSADMFTSFSETCPGIYDEDEDICCIAKMYDCEEACFKLNDMIEIVGIYTSDPILESNEEDMGGSLLEQMMDPFRGFDEMDESQSLPPPR
jgi:dihydroxyacetone kinase-like predicted kinase